LARPRNYNTEKKLELRIFGYVIPKEIVEKYGWREKQKMTIHE